VGTSAAAPAGDGTPLRVRVKKNGSSASVIDRGGASAPATQADGWWVADLPAATAHYPEDHPYYYFIGGEPRLLVESGVEPSAPVAAPALGDPGGAVREFKLFPNPADGQTVGQGQAAELFISIRGYEGFGDPVSFRLSQWSTQRVPEPQDPSALPIQLRLPGAIVPGLTATVRFETVGAEPGIYFLQLEATGGGQSRTVDLALVVN